MRKVFLSIALIFASFLSLQAQRVPKIEVYFQRYHSLQDLNNIQGELKAMGIQLEYEQIQFDEQGRLQGLGIRVDCKDGFSGSAYVSPVPEDLSFGFLRDYREHAAYPFLIGNIGSSRNTAPKKE
ncbi:MAG: hypothetical protein NZM43_12365 [Saprospiraceae bacterium]|nr:hypothetical protein [Saprospiraceae bacterium]MDW8485106.1 hypothetical protein [Saprospiraceae bacterium]